MSESATANTNRETLGFQAEVKQLLQLMIHSLYSNKEIFLRELISNASDAADKLRFEALSNDSLYEGDSELKIRLEFDKEKRTITIIDNGIGRKKSHENAQLNPVKIKSFGVDITRKRIELFSNKYTEITEETTDVLNSSNQIDGTHVKLKIYTKN